MPSTLHGLAALAGLVVTAASAQVTTFDPATNLLTIPSVSVGSASFANVTLRHVGNYVFALQGGTPQVPAAAGVAGFNLASGLLAIPAVKVGDATYLGLTLLADAGLNLTLQAAMPDGRKLGLFQGWDFHQGPKTGNTGSQFNPAFRTLSANFPGSQATSTAAWVVAPRQPEPASKTYFEHTLLYVDRNNRQILSVVSFF